MQIATCTHSEQYLFIAIFSSSYFFYSQFSEKMLQNATCTRSAQYLFYLNFLLPISFNSPFSEEEEKLQKSDVHTLQKFA